MWNLREILLQVFYRVFVRLFVDVGLGICLHQIHQQFCWVFFTTMIKQPSQLYCYTISTSAIKPWMLLALLYNRRKNFELNYHSVVNSYYDFLLLMPSLSCKMLLWKKCYLKSDKCMISSRFTPAMKFETVWRYSFEIIFYKTIYTCPRFSSSVHGT